MGRESGGALATRHAGHRAVEELVFGLGSRRKVELYVLRKDQTYEVKSAKEHPTIDGLLTTKDGRVWLMPRAGASLAIQSSIPYSTTIEDAIGAIPDTKSRFWGLVRPTKRGVVYEDDCYLLSTDTSFRDWLRYLSTKGSYDEALKEFKADFHQRFKIDKMFDAELKKWERKEHLKDRLEKTKSLLHEILLRLNRRL